MTAEPLIPDAAADAISPSAAVDRTRMSFGEHLEELRAALLRALLGIGLATVIGFLFAVQVLKIIFRPLLLVQARQGLSPNLQALSPTSTFMAYLKVAFLSGLILAMPWVFLQAWSFVSVGLYPREKAFVRRLIWPSVLLFAVGVAFLYFVVLPIVLNFFISFNRKFEMPDFTPAIVQSLVEPTPGLSAVTDRPLIRPKIPVVQGELPNEAEPGEIVFDQSKNRLLVKTNSEWRSVALDPGEVGSVIQSQFALDAYIGFVLTLALAFGLAFETPVVVFFLAWTGLVPTETMVRSRRYVILGVVVASAILTPTPDVLSQLLLAGPMYLLFELGVFAARWAERRVPSRAL